MSTTADPEQPPTIQPYFRRDQAARISPPDLSKPCSYAEHIVHARGKRTQFTSVSLDPAKIRDFGDTTYRLKRELTQAHGHALVEHEELLDELRRVINEGSKAERARAIHARRYATWRKEGLVRWSFNFAGVKRKGLIAWAETRVQVYFSRV